MLKENELYEEKLRVVNEKLEATQTLLSKAKAKVEECSSLLQRALIVNTTLARQRKYLLKVTPTFFSLKAVF